MTDALIISSDNFATFVGRMSPLLDERERRLFAGSLANMLGRGGLKRVSELTLNLQQKKRDHLVALFFDACSRTV